MATIDERYFDIFEAASRGSGAAAAVAPAAPQRREEPESKIRPFKGKSGRQREQERRIGIVRVAVAVFFVFVVFSQVALSIHYRADLYKLEKEITAAENRLAVVRDENVRLNTELNKFTSMDKIAAYATLELGMVPAEQYQIERIDLSEGSSVLYSSRSGGSSLFR